ncbi:hypothetical protein AMJ80_12610 [bacterium SM23_31]|nr:MAG: hypothetical protein AMJ80_12610 [bacterium SM23_31]
MPVRLDKTDIEILKILQKNGRITNAELAKKAGISPPPMLERVRKLEKNGVIRKYVALVDPSSIGIETFTFVEVTLSRHGKDAVKEFIDAATKIEELLEFYHITGDADLIINKLIELPHILHLKTMVVLKTYKSETSFNIVEGGDDK